MWRSTFAALAIALVCGGAAASCSNKPTEIVLDVRTDVPCESSQGTTITVGSPSSAESRPPTTTTSACSGDGAIGSLAIFPSGGDGDLIGVRVVQGVDRAASECQPPDYDGCIVARRSIQFVPRTKLVLPVTMEAACRNVPCSEGQTCVHGACRPSSIDSSTCIATGRCADEPPGEPQPVEDAGVDAEVEPDADAGPTCTASDTIDIANEKIQFWIHLFATQEGYEVVRLARDVDTDAGEPPTLRATRIAPDGARIGVSNTPFPLTTSDFYFQAAGLGSGTLGATVNVVDAGPSLVLGPSTDLAKAKLVPLPDDVGPVPRGKLAFVGGRLAIAYARRGAGPTVVFVEDGGTLSPKHDINTSAVTDVSATAARSGELVVTANRQPGAQCFVQRVAADGGMLGPTLDLPVEPRGCYLPVTAETETGYAVVWGTNITVGDVRVTLLDKTGRTVKSFVAVEGADDAGTFYRFPKIVATTAGLFVFYTGPSGGKNNGLFVRQFSLDGAPVGDAKLLAIAVAGFDAVAQGSGYAFVFSNGDRIAFGRGCP